MDAAESTYF